MRALPTGTLIRVRMGVHTGTPHVTGEGAIEAEEARRPLGGWAKERDRLDAVELALGDKLGESGA